MEAERIAAMVRCACYFRDRARCAASRETRLFHLGWMRAHALEAARRIKELRGKPVRREPLSGKPYQQRDSQDPFVMEERLVRGLCVGRLA